MQKFNKLPNPVKALVGVTGAALTSAATLWAYLQFGWHYTFNQVVLTPQNNVTRTEQGFIGNYDSRIPFLWGKAITEVKRTADQNCSSGFRREVRDYVSGTIHNLEGFEQVENLDLGGYSHCSE